MNRVTVIAFWAAAAFAFVMAVIPAPPSLPAPDKLQHMLAFAVLAALSVAAFPRVPAWKLFLAFATFGGMIELVQSTRFVGRDGDWLDWLADLVAAGSVLLIGSFFRKVRKWAVSA